jgi:ADP-Ribosyltransferase in polyvalent proteins
MFTKISDWKIFESITQPIKVYHGTNQQFDTFDLDKSYDGGVWFTDNIESIKNNTTGAGHNKYIMIKYLNIKNPAGWDEYDRYSLDQLINMGYDCVILPEDDKIDYLVFDLSCIKDN